MVEPDRVLAEVRAHEIRAGGSRVSLVEHEVQHGEHRAQPLREEVVRRYAERDARGANLPLRTDESLRHRGLGDEEGSSDLAGREPADLAQCQRDTALGGQRRVAAREDEREPLVGDGAHVVLLGGELLQAADELRLLLEDLLAAESVDRAVAGGRDDPGARSARHPVARPALQGGGECVLHCVLGELEVAEDAREDRDGASPFIAEDALDVRLHPSVIAEPGGSRSNRASPSGSTRPL